MPSGRFERAVVSCGGFEGGEDCGQQESQPFEEASEVVSGGGEDGVGGVAVGSGEVISAHAVLGLGVADGLGDATSLA
jgi:hypothetical protein